MKIEQTVYVVDDDEAIRKALRLLLKSVGLKVETFASAQEFLDAYTEDMAGCLVLDIRMAGMSGIDLQKKLIEMHAILPIIFITGHGDVPLAVEAMRDGALDFIQKPFSEQKLLDRVNQALEKDLTARKDMTKKQTLLDRIAQLTPREKEVMDLIVAGVANKGVAYKLGISERTVEIHRARVMQKMNATSLPHLVRMALKAKQ